MGSAIQKFVMSSMTQTFIGLQIKLQNNYKGIIIDIENMKFLIKFYLHCASVTLV